MDQEILSANSIWHRTYINLQNSIKENRDPKRALTHISRTNRAKHYENGKGFFPLCTYLSLKVLIQQIYSLFAPCYLESFYLSFNIQVKCHLLDYTFNSFKTELVTRLPSESILSLLLQVMPCCDYLPEEPTHQAIVTVRALSVLFYLQSLSGY